MPENKSSKKPVAAHVQHMPIRVADGGLRSATVRPELTRCPGAQRHGPDNLKEVADGGLRCVTARPEPTRSTDHRRGVIENLTAALVVPEVKDLKNPVIPDVERTQNRVVDGGLRLATVRAELTRCPGMRKQADNDDSQRLQSRVADGGQRPANATGASQIYRPAQGYD